MQASQQTQQQMPKWYTQAQQKGIRALGQAYKTPAEEVMGYQTAAGQMLTQNPYMEEMVRQAQAPIVEQYTEAIAPTLSSQFAQGGRFGSGLYREAQKQRERQLGRQLGEAATRMYGEQYGRERALMEAAAERFDPLKRAQAYMTGISGATAPTSTTTMQPVQTASPFAQFLGGALSGGATGAQIGGPWGAGIGAGLGGILGMAG
jgi:hypothetical protein